MHTVHALSYLRPRQRSPCSAVLLSSVWRTHCKGPFLTLLCLRLMIRSIFRVPFFINLLLDLLLLVSRTFPLYPVHDATSSSTYGWSETMNQWNGKHLDPVSEAFRPLVHKRDERQWLGKVRSFPAVVPHSIHFHSKSQTNISVSQRLSCTQAPFFWLCLYKFLYCSMTGDLVFSVFCIVHSALILITIFSKWAAYVCSSHHCTSWTTFREFWIHSKQ